jgi:hypothetical protein
MAVNLLLIANQMRGNLHNSPSGSRTRSSDANEPGNLPSGGPIPGTNINQDAGIRSVARKGRRGDTELRRVGGEVSHVNTTEANAIDTLGPMGEAWVKNIGSGTTNPKTGLREYGTWRPSQGKWGIFGSTKASKKRDRAKAAAKARHKIFEKFRREYEQENIAGIWTADEDVDDTQKIMAGGWSSGLNPEFENFVTDKSGLVTSAADAAAAKEKMGKMMQTWAGNQGKYSDEANAAAGVAAGEKQTESNKNDIMDYLDPYDPRKQDELSADYGRNLERLGLQEDKAFTQDIMNQKATGSQISSGLFGMLTESQNATAQKGFAGSGDFAADFQKKQVIADAERSVNAGQTDREMQLEGQKIETEQAVADLASGTADLQEDYNQEFWNSMVSWDSAINS